MGAFNPNSKSRASAWKPSFQSIFSALQRCRTRSSVIDGTPDLRRSVWATARSKNLTMIQSVLLVPQSREQLFFFGHLCTVVLSISCCKRHLGAFHIKFLRWKSEDTCRWFWKNHPIPRNLPLQTLLYLFGTGADHCSWTLQDLLLRVGMPRDTYRGTLDTLPHQMAKPCHASCDSQGQNVWFYSHPSTSPHPSSCRDVKLKEFLPTGNFFLCKGMRCGHTTGHMAVSFKQC